MQNLLDLNLSSCFWQDQGSNLLLNPDFEGAAGPPPASWSVWNCAGSRQAGARTDGSGLYVGREAYDGVNPVGFMYQGACTINRRYHSYGWMRSDGTTALLWGDGTGVTFWTRAATGVWTPFEETHVGPAAANIGIVAALAAGKWVEADDLFLYEQFLYTRAQGTLAQTPTTSRIQCGDGRTAATFPTQLGVAQGVQMGMRFDGNQYLQWRNTLASGTYTVCFLMQKLTTTPSLFLMDARDTGGTGFVWVNAGNVLAASSGTIYVDEQATTTLNYGQLCFVAVSGITLNITTFLNIMIGAAGAFGLPSNLYGMNLRVGALTPRQLRDQRQRMLARVHGP